MRPCMRGTKLNENGVYVMSDNKRSKKDLKPISLHPLKLDEAVSGIMQFNPKDAKDYNEDKKGKLTKDQTK